MKSRPDLTEYAEVVAKLGFPVVSVQQEACNTLWCMIGEDTRRAALAAEAEAVAALVLLLDVQRDGLGVLSSHNKVPSLFLAAVNTLIALAQDDTIARPKMVRAKASKIAQTNLSLFDGTPEGLEDAVQQLVAAEAGDLPIRTGNTLLVQATCVEANP